MFRLFSQHILILFDILSKSVAIWRSRNKKEQNKDQTIWTNETFTFHLMFNGRFVLWQKGIFVSYAVDEMKNIPNLYFMDVFAFEFAFFVSFCLTFVGYCSTNLCTI